MKIKRIKDNKYIVNILDLESNEFVESYVFEKKDTILDFKKEHVEYLKNETQAFSNFELEEVK